MVQQFYVVRCCSCGSCQVHIVRKDGKFCCKMCGVKQSVRKVYGKGSARDCRLHVQKLNDFIASKNSADEAHLVRDALCTAASKLPSDGQRNDETEWLRGDQNSTSQAGVYVPLTSHSNSAVEKQFNGIPGHQSARYCLGDEVDGNTGDQVSHSNAVMEKPFQGFPDRNFIRQRVDEERVCKNRESSLSYNQISLPIKRNDESFMDFEQFEQDFEKFDSHCGIKRQLGEGSSVLSLPGPSGIGKLEMDTNGLNTTKTTRKTKSLEIEHVSNGDFCYHAASEEAYSYKQTSSSGDPSSVMGLSRDHLKERIPYELDENSPVGRSKPFAEDEGKVFTKKAKYAPNEDEAFAKKTTSSRGPSASPHVEVRQIGEGHTVTVKNGSDCTVHGLPSKSILYSKYSRCDDLDDLTF